MSAASGHRLPRAVRPFHYQLELAPDLDAATFSGTVRISAEVAETTDTIVLNAVELELREASVVDASGPTALTWQHDDVNERLTLSVPHELEPGSITLELSFDGILNDKLRGFYRSTFLDHNGTTRTIATTQFESTNARRAFPCWDEPDLKATFDVALVVSGDLLAISSASELGREVLDDGRHRVQFGTTMVMSTYLLAFVVGPLETSATVDVDGVPLRVVHPPGKGHLADFALDVGAFSLRHFTDYFAIPYPGEKLDLVGLPDFAFGAMENLGCVTFREALLLLDEAETTQPEQQRVADVIAHEIAHMWFGDLVTMKWWDGIWLKEAFATFCEMHATNTFRPNWLRWEDFSLSRSAAFDVDALTTTRPIEFEVISPDDAEAMYDTLTYEKGAAVVRMLEQYLGEDQFRQGIRHYLRAHSYSNTETHDLWDAIETATGQPARQIMDSWILQGGFPLITAELTSPTTVRLRQERFSYLPPTDGDLEWSIPMVLAVGQGEERRRHPVLLDRTELEVDLGPGPVSWLVGNAEASGFYRMRNLGELHRASTTALAQLTAVERYSLVDDMWASFVADQAQVSDVLSLIEAVGVGESDTSVWRRISNILRIIDRHIDGETRAKHRRMAIDIVAPALLAVGIEPAPEEMANRSELRATLFETAGVFGASEQIATARALLDSPADPPRNAAAIRIVAANGTADDFRFFVKQYEEAATPQEERRYLFALPLFEGAGEVAELLEMLDTDRIRAQDGGYVLGRALSQNGSAKRVWAYIEHNWDAIGERYPDNSIPRMIEGAQGVGDPEVADAIQAFFDVHDLPQAGQTLFQHLERMQVTVGIRRRLRDQLG